MPDVPSNRLGSAEQFLRDLEWVIRSPFLINSEPSLLPKCPPETFTQGRLESFVSTRLNHRVGNYFETLIEFWLKSASNTDQVRRNVQLQAKGRTQGEIDFLFTDPQGRTIHWETAVKFYLYHATETVKGSHYIGPNTNDTFENKLNRLFTHQLHGQHPEQQKATVHEPFVKGRIFYHPEHPKPQTLPEHLSPKHLKATWLTASEWPDYVAALPCDRFAIIPKPFWLAPQDFPRLPSTDLWDSQAITQTIAAHFQTKTISLLVAAFDDQDRHGIEKERIFIVNNTWPKPPK